MEWCKLYSRLPRDMALRRAGEPAIVLFVFGLCHCAEEETDGFIADDVLPTLALPNVQRRAAALVKHGLWEPVDGGYTIPKWEPLQRELYDLIRRRRKDADRARMKRKQSKEQSSYESRDASTNASADGSTDSSDTERRKDLPPNPAGAGRCAKHRTEPGTNCRACGTNVRAMNAAAKAAKPPWCGVCDETTRLREAGFGMQRCPNCHPEPIRAVQGWD